MGSPFSMILSAAGSILPESVLSGYVIFKSFLLSHLSDQFSDQVSGSLSILELFFLQGEVQDF